MQNPRDSKIAIIGQCHVGLPLATEFGKHCDVKHALPREAADRRPR